ncbi:MAG: hypothetical protein IJM25_12035, partial [Eubacterium sp.]|nr:hypothetical protein [Eubacterium sp.]
MSDFEKRGGTPENDIMKSGNAAPVSESLSLSDVMVEVLPSEEATTVLTEGMSGTLAASEPEVDDGFKNASGMLTSPQAGGQQLGPNGKPMGPAGQQPMGPAGQQPMGQGGRPMNPQGMGPNGQPMGPMGQGMAMGPNGRPMNPQGMGPNGQPMGPMGQGMAMGPNGRPMNPQGMGPNGQPMGPMGQGMV